MTYQTDDLRIQSIQDVSAPAEVCKEIPISDKAAQVTQETRQAIHNILTGEDDRLLVVAGPCSIHDPAVAKDYAGRIRPSGRRARGHNPGAGEDANTEDSSGGIMIRPSDKGGAGLLERMMRATLRLEGRAMNKTSRLVPFGHTHIVLAEKP